MCELIMNENINTAKDLPVGTLDLSPLAIRSLELAGIKTLGQLASATDQELKRLRGIGEKKLPEILAARDKCQKLGSKAITIKINGSSVGEINIPITATITSTQFDENTETIEINY